MRFGTVSPEFKRLNDVHPLVDQKLGYAWLDAASISIEFCGAISTQFCFIYSLRASLLCRAGYALGSATLFIRACGRHLNTSSQAILSEAFSCSSLIADVTMSNY